MTQQTIILPYDRVSPIHMQRRDLVLSSADSLTLRVTIVESDDPSAQAIYLTGGIGGPSVRLSVWSDSTYCRTSWDYGAYPQHHRVMLWASVGVIADALGSFDIAIPVGAMTLWPRLCSWAIQLDFESGSKSEMLASGNLHVVWGPSSIVTDTGILTDTGDQVTGDDLTSVEA